MTTRYEQEYKKGIESEKEVLPIIRDYFKRDIKLTKERYSKFDYYDLEYKYELKTRTNKYNSFPTTIIETNKIIDNLKIIFLFRFTNGLYFIEYEKELFDTFKKDLYIRNNPTIQSPIKKEHIFIPINKLTKI
jgi:hypothetical protein